MQGFPLEFLRVLKFQRISHFHEIDENFVAYVIVKVVIIFMEAKIIFRGM